MRTLTYTAKCSRATHVGLQAFLEQQRQLWNAGLEQRKAAYRRQRASLTAYGQYKQLTDLRKDAEYGQYQAACQRSALNRLHKAVQSFFARLKAGKKPGFPRFKGRGRVRSFEFPHPPLKRRGKRWVLSVKGVGKFRFRHDGRLDARPLLARIVSTPRRVKVQLLTETPSCDWQDDRPALGVDVGIASQVTLSSGEQYPKRRRSLTQLRRLGRRLSRAVRGSNGRRKKRLALAKEHQRVAERERGYLHELTARLVKERSSRFCIEALRIRNLVQNHRLARSILEQQWGAFGMMLTYKAESAGGWVRQVNPRNTSQRCSGCGVLPACRLTLGDRTYVCMDCGLVLDRDMNAARNILQAGLPGLPGGTAPARSVEEDDGRVRDWPRTQNRKPGDSGSPRI